MLNILHGLSNMMGVIGAISIIFYVVIRFLACKLGQNTIMILIYIVAFGVPTFILYNIGIGFIQGISGK